MPAERREKGRCFNFFGNIALICCSVKLICEILIASLIIRFCHSEYVRNLSITLSLNSHEIKAVEVHHLRPRSYEVTHELLLRVLLCVNLGEGSELGVRAEDQVDGGAGPLRRAGGAIAPLVHVLTRVGSLPLCAHVQQIHEEVVGQRPGALGEDTASGLSSVSVE